MHSSKHSIDLAQTKPNQTNDNLHFAHLAVTYEENFSYKNLSLNALSTYTAELLFYGTWIVVFQNSKGINEQSDFLVFDKGRPSIDPPRQHLSIFSWKSAFPRRIVASPVQKPRLNKHQSGEIQKILKNLRRNVRDESRLTSILLSKNSEPEGTCICARKDQCPWVFSLYVLQDRVPWRIFTGTNNLS